MIVEMAIAGMLSDGGMEGVSIARRSVLDMPECIYVGHGTYERADRFADGERGTYQATVYVCRDIDQDAERAASECGRTLRDADWERYADLGDARICTLDAGAPEFKERDSSGRYVYELKVSLVVDRHE